MNNTANHPPSGASTDQQQQNQQQQQSNHLNQRIVSPQNSSSPSHPHPPPHPQPPQQHHQQQQQQHQQHQQQLHLPAFPQNISQETLRELITKAQEWRSQGQTEQTHPKYAELVNFLRHFSKQTLRAQPQQYQPKPSAQAQSMPSGTNASAQSPPPSRPFGDQQKGAVPAGEHVQKSSMPASTHAPIQQAPFNASQIAALKYQILAYKFIAKNMPVPAHLQQAVFSQAGTEPNAVDWSKQGSAQSATSISAKIVQAAAAHYVPAAFADPVGGPETSSDGQPAHSYTNFIAPYAQLQKTLVHNARQQRFIVPSLLPVGIDPYALVQERERQVRARINYRIAELENLPGNLSNEAATGESEDPQHKQIPSSTKLKALIELKALRLLDRQRRLREEMVKGMTKATTLATQTDRALYRRMKKQSLREARLTERLERQQRLERDRREKQKHHDFLNSIVNHRTEMMRFHSVQQNRASVLTRKVFQFHNQVEKDEAKKADKMSKARLSALKNDDEEAYLKLVDQAKDTRITHLLQQTDEYLSNLTQSIRSQQTDDLHNDPTMKGEVELMDEHADGEELDEAKSKQDYYGVAHKIREVVTEQPSILVGGKLKDYQLKGLQWMVSLYNNRLNGILADEMGLGKTIQTISLVTHLIESKKQNGPFLIIVPLSTLTNWTLEFEKWAPSVRKIVYKGVPTQRKVLQAEIRMMNFQVLLTTYEYIIKDRPTLARVKWVHMIIDEGHRMKNTQSKLTTVLTQYYTTRYRLILTGTPLQNNLPELWALLNFVLPRIFNSVKSFDEWFNTPFSSQGGQDKIALTEEEQLLVIKRLHKVLRPFLLRRLKKDVEAELPDKVERVIKCKMSALQLKLYNQMKSHGMLFTGADGTKGRSGIKGLNNTIMQLRKICNHPYVFEEVEKVINPMKLNDEKLYRVSGKFELLDRVLPKFFKTGHRVLIFFQMTAIMNIMEDFLHFRGYKYLRLDGTIKADDRSDLLKKFNSPESDIFVFLLSTRAGGLGLNLQTADTVVIFDSDWNPHQDLQAQDRAHRIGQTKEVRILRLVTEKSVEETILARAQFKLDIDGKVIQAGKFDNKTSGEDRDALLRALLAGESDEANDVAENEDMDDEELNEIISRSDEETNIFRSMDRERELDAEQRWRITGERGPPPPRLMQEEELPEIYLLDYKAEAARAKLEADAEELGKGRRQKGAIRYADGLTDEQWMEAMQNEDMDAEEALNAKMDKKRRRMEKRARKLAKAQKRTEDTACGSVEGDFAAKEGEDEDDDDLENDADDDDNEESAVVSQSSTPVPGTPKDVRRLPQSGLAGTPNVDDDGAVPKKRRARKKKLDEDSSSVVGADTPRGTVKKRDRRKASESVEESVPDRLDVRIRRQMRALLGKVLQATENVIAEDGHRRSDLFQEPVSRKDYPVYYQIIKKPICLADIRRRIATPYYRHPNEFRDDFLLMFDNAQEFNEAGSYVWLDAEAMRKVFEQEYAMAFPGGQLPPLRPGEFEQDEERPLKRTRDEDDSEGEGDDDLAESRRAEEPSKPSTGFRIKLKAPAAPSSASASDPHPSESSQPQKKQKIDDGRSPHSQSQGYSYSQVERYDVDGDDRGEERD